MKAVVSEKGQVTIPKELRKRLGIKAGTVLDFETDGGRLVGRKAVEPDPFQDLYGILDLGESTDDFIERIRGR
jgi:antitoxin PrlF